MRNLKIFIGVFIIFIGFNFSEVCGAKKFRDPEPWDWSSEAYYNKGIAKELRIDSLSPKWVIRVLKKVDPKLLEKPEKIRDIYNKKGAKEFIPYVDNFIEDSLNRYLVNTWRRVTDELIYKMVSIRDVNLLRHTFGKIGRKYGQIVKYSKYKNRVYKLKDAFKKEFNRFTYGGEKSTYNFFDIREFAFKLYVTMKRDRVFGKVIRACTSRKRGYDPICAIDMILGFIIPVKYKDLITRSFNREISSRITSFLIAKGVIAKGKPPIPRKKWPSYKPLCQKKKPQRPKARPVLTRKVPVRRGAAPTKRQKKIGELRKMWEGPKKPSVPKKKWPGYKPPRPKKKPQRPKVRPVRTKKASERRKVDDLRKIWEKRLGSK